MSLEKSEGLLGVVDGIFWAALEVSLITILHRDRDHAARGEVMAVGNELSGGREVPKTTVKEDNYGAAVDLIIVISREEEVRHQVTLRSLLVDV